MKLRLNHFMYFPGGDDEPLASSDAEGSGQSENEKAKEPKGFFQKIKDALQDWSNKDQEDQDFDDTKV